MQSLSNNLKTPLSNEQRDLCLSDFYSRRDSAEEFIILDLGPDNSVNERTYGILKGLVHESRVIVLCAPKSIHEGMSESIPLPRAFDYTHTSYLKGLQYFGEEAISNFFSGRLK